MIEIIKASDAIPTWSRAKAVLALLCLVLSGLLLGAGMSTIHFSAVIRENNSDWRASLAAVQHQLSVESGINRATLRELVNNTDANTDAIGRLLSKADQATTKASKASETATQASETAERAATAAATTAADVATYTGQVGPPLPEGEKP